MAKGLSQGFKRRSSGGGRRGGGKSLGGGKGLGMAIVLGGAGVLMLAMVGALFYFANKAETSAPPKALITHEAKNVGGG
jgi:hypothetical protein